LELCFHSKKIELILKIPKVHRLFGTRDLMLIKIFLFGIDFAGKTAILNCLKYGTPKKTKPTLAFNIVSLELEGFELQVWDAPGQQNLRKLWNNGFNKARFMIFVLDVADSNRYQEALNEFIKVTNEPDSKSLPILFCFHKMDLLEAQENLERSKLTFSKVISENKVAYILETSIFQDNTIEKLKKTIIQMVKDLGLKHE
jgi:small GTP-binding protein